MGFVLAGSFINALAVNVGMWIGGEFRSRIACPTCLILHRTLNCRPRLLSLSPVGRATIGVGIGMSKVAAPVLIQEMAHPRLRPILGSCYQSEPLDSLSSRLGIL